VAVVVVPVDRVMQLLVVVELEYMVLEVSTLPTMPVQAAAEVLVVVMVDLALAPAQITMEVHMEEAEVALNSMEKLVPVLEVQ
jgi:hypothetical protein